LRIAFAVIASLYLVALVRHPPQWRGLHAVGFFTESTCLFPYQTRSAVEYRLEAWSCSEKKWRPIDPRVYFPIEADDKESRFQRLAHFYHRDRPTMRALDAWLMERVDERIGGIRLYRWERPIPAPGEPVDRYEYDPFAPIPPQERHDLFYTPGPERKQRCNGS
jgi:hypothetical protein